MSYEEDSLLPLSGLQHLMFCERQAALIHVEQVWADNARTIEGSRLHKAVDEAGARREKRGDLVILRGLIVRSLRLGLVGRVDVVELRRSPEMSSSAERDTSSARIKGLQGTWIPCPVEYKRGKPKSDQCDEVQVCAQAICLEEALGVPIAEGALYYGERRRRTPVLFTAGLRNAVEAAAHRLHELVRAGVTPAASPRPGCEQCSLKETCLPSMFSGRRHAQKYLKDLVKPDGSDELM